MTNSPTRIGNYKLERRIGRGGMSEVWLARHRSLDDRLVAIKVLLSQDPEWIERFGREANITSRLRHEHIVQIYDHGCQPPFYYTVMEYVPGGSLRDLLAGGQRFSIDQALLVFRCVGMALDYAHAHGVIHRDVSPGNILIEQGGSRILLTDFGIAREPGKGVTTITKVMGTPGYLSPEHATSATAVTHLSDLFSLGVVLFEMLSGQRPWDHNPGMPDESGGPFTPIYSLRDRGVDTLPADVDRVIQTLLTLEQSKRYPSAQAAIEDLDRVLQRHTSPTLVVPGRSGRPTGAVVRPDARNGASEVVQPPHPVETILGRDLIKGPIQEARKRAELLADPSTLSALLNRWSQEGLLRRRMLGRQALLHRATSTNIYFYTLRVLYESREPASTIEEPDRKALAPVLEKELDRWSVPLPEPRGFEAEAGGTVVLPGSTHVAKCDDCDGLGRKKCPECNGTQRVKVPNKAPAADAPARARPATAGTNTPPASLATAGQAARSARGTLTATNTTTPATMLVPCPTCQGTGALPCKRCDGVGRLVKKKTTTWTRSAKTFSINDDLPQVDEAWLRQACKPSQVYREQQSGGYRPEWLAVPGIADLIAEANKHTDENTRVARSEVTISFIPVTEIIFDLGELPPRRLRAQHNPPPMLTYSWHIYGFEERLPNDWRFLNWDRIWALLLGGALLVLLLVLLLPIVLRLL